jgi:hypothetical protein
VLSHRRLDHRPDCGGLALSCPLGWQRINLTNPVLTMELNVFGDFAPGPWKTNAEVLAAINSNRDDWFPSKVELRQMAASGPGLVEGAVNVWNLLCSIVRHKPNRVNIFTHATEALSGRVVKGNVLFALNPDTELSPETISNADAEGFAFSDSKTKNATMRDVRTALPRNAQFIVYACHSGLEQTYLKRLAGLLRVSVGGFEDEIRYYPEPSADRKSICWLYSQGAGKKVKDFHGLSPTFVQP